jgi:hypothetical protein
VHQRVSGLLDLQLLVRQGYVIANPFAAVQLPPGQQRARGSSRTLTCAHWDHIVALLQEHVDTEVRRRLVRDMRWLYATGDRLGKR